jgi:hypothetical protein
LTVQLSSEKSWNFNKSNSNRLYFVPPRSEIFGILPTKGKLTVFCSAEQRKTLDFPTKVPPIDCLLRKVLEFANKSDSN